MHAERIPSVNSQLPTSKSQPLSNSNSQLPIKSELGSSRVEPTRAAWCLTDLAVRTVAVIAVVIVCLAGCRFESTNPQLPPRPLERNTHTLSLPRNRRHQPSDRTKLLGQLEAANAHWNREGPMTYELTVSLRCFCDPGVPFVSRVTGVTLVRSTGGYRRDGRSWGPSLRTVQLLFSEARRAIYSDADEVEVEFDPRFRYPTRIRIDDWRDSTDDELEWIATLQVL